MAQLFSLAVMKHRLIGRIISGIVLALIVNTACYLDSVHREHIGREEFLARQTARYDRAFAEPTFTHYLIPSLIVLAVLFALYELFAFVIAKLIAKT